MAKKKSNKKPPSKKSSAYIMKYGLLFTLLILGILLLIFWLHYELKESEISIYPKREEVTTYEDEKSTLDNFHHTEIEKNKPEYFDTKNGLTALERLDSLKKLEHFIFCNSAASDQIVAHSYFALAYVESHEQASWVSYKLPKSHLEKVASRGNNFKSDPLVATFSAHPDDYKNSGFDRGHLAPAGDFTFSDLAMNETFFMSNMSPQSPAFNRGIWKKLEEQVRNWAGINEELFVITGPVLVDSLPQIGKNGVSVPEYYYKVVYDLHMPVLKAIAFVLPNEASKDPLSKYCITVDSLENLLQIDFLPLLPDSVEQAIEKNIQPNLWFRD